MERNRRWMKAALAEAEKAYEAGEVPVGAIVVSPTGEMLGKGYNQREALNDPTAHAEMLAISAAANSLEDWRLENCLLYVTLEPCPMCAGAIVNARIETVIYGAADQSAGACGSKFSICGESILNHKTSVVSGVLADQCQQILTEFFSQTRNPLRSNFT